VDKGVFVDKIFKSEQERLVRYAWHIRLGLKEAVAILGD